MSSYCCQSSHVSILPCNFNVLIFYWLKYTYIVSVPVCECVCFSCGYENKNGEKKERPNIIEYSACVSRALTRHDWEGVRSLYSYYSLCSLTCNNCCCSWKSMYIQYMRVVEKPRGSGVNQLSKWPFNLYIFTLFCIFFFFTPLAFFMFYYFYIFILPSSSSSSSIY